MSNNPTQNGNPMPEHSIRRLAPAALFLPAYAEPAVEVPAWWPNDKQLVLDFRPPPAVVHDDEEA